jgi:oligopeptidase B
MENTSTKMPLAEEISKELILHGDTRLDPYYWLNERENPAVIRYLEEENAYRKASMQHTEALQEKLFHEIKNRIKEDDQSVPYKKNGYWYYVRFEQGEEHPIYCRKKGDLNAPEQILLNVNELAKGHDYYKVGGLSISPDNQWIAFGEDTLSRRIYTIRFKHLETGEIKQDESLLYTTGSVAWAADSQTLFYTVKDSTLRSHAIYRHKLHTSNASDVLIFQENDATFNTGVYKSKSEAYILIHSSSTVSDEYQYLPADTPEGDFTMLQKRERNLEFGVAHFGEHWYIRTNKDGAENFKLMKTEIAKSEKEHWVDVVPHRKEVFLENIEIFKDYLVTEEREHGLTRIHIARWDGQEAHDIAFEEETYTAGIGNNPDFNSTTLRYAYSSLTVPTSVIDYHMETREKEVKKQQEVVGGYSADDYESERIWATAEDGVQVPISLVYKKSLRKKGGNPTLLYGYGSYGATIDPSFSSTRLSLLDRGFVFAIAHIRGGQYLGRNWYETGKMLHKKNTFTDFIACGEQLLNSGYTAADKLYGMGGSAGGLLIGAVINLRPELFKGVIAAVPFVDVVTTMLDESIPLTTGEYDEWGNPNDPEFYAYIKSYSPYDNIEAKAYPAMLVTTGLHDSQVQYWEPAKWVAKLRKMKTNNNPLYLETNMETGHGGASGRYEAYKETAMEYAFFLDLEGIHT